jgi:hypothetical protein
MHSSSIHQLSLADAVDDPFDAASVEFRILAGVLTRPARTRNRVWKRRKLAALAHIGATMRFAGACVASVFAGAAVGTGIAALLLSAAPVMAQLGGIA